MGEAHARRSRPTGWKLENGYTAAAGLHKRLLICTHKYTSWGYTKGQGALPACAASKMRVQELTVDVEPKRGRRRPIRSGLGTLNSYMTREIRDLRTINGSPCAGRCGNVGQSTLPQTLRDLPVIRFAPLGDGNDDVTLLVRRE